MHWGPPSTFRIRGEQRPAGSMRGRRREKALANGGGKREKRTVGSPPSPELKRDLLERRTVRPRSDLWLTLGLDRGGAERAGRLCDGPPAQTGPIHFLAHLAPLYDTWGSFLREEIPLRALRALGPREGFEERDRCLSDDSREHLKEFYQILTK